MPTSTRSTHTAGNDALSALRLEADRQFAIYGIVAMVVPVVVFIWVDILNYSSLPFVLIARLVVRALLIAVGIVAVSLVLRAATRDRFERLVFSWTTFALAATVVIQTLQPSGGTMKIRVPLLYLTAIYATLPNRGLRQIVPPIGFVGALILLRFVWLNGGSVTDIVSDILILTLSVTMGTLLLRRRYALDRDAAVAVEAESEARLSFQESEERTRQIIDTALDAVITYDSDGRISGWNPQAARIFGWTAHEAIGRTLSETIRPPSAMSPGPDRWTELAAGGEQTIDRRFELHAVTQSGAPLFVEMSVAPVVIRGGLQFSAFVRDITGVRLAERERERLHEQLTQKTKMESVGRLAGGVAHDFNNMLSVILGQTELLMADMGSSHPLYRDLEEIQRAAQRSADLTAQLLAFARKQTVAPRLIDANSAVSQMLTMLRRLIGEDIAVSWEPGAALWPVMIDPTQLDQILANLCVNARDAIAGVGRVSIETRNVVVDATFASLSEDYRPGEFVMLAVSDSGHGMDEETRSHIFEPFFTTKPVGSGTGLGLPMVYGIVQQNGGFVSVYSVVDAGTSIRIYLPRHVGLSPTATVHEGTSSVAGGTETVLLVEDEPAILSLTRKILERSGYRVLAAASPDEAMHIAQDDTGPIDALLTDVVMPGMSGPDLAALLAARYPAMVTIFMSGHTANMISPDGVLKAGVHFLPKPFSLQSLTAKLREALERGPR